MAVYHQMGHHSKNLLMESDLDLYSGAILSPVNYCEDDIISQISSVKDNKHFEMIFDPQLYYPKSDRGVLPQWPFYPCDFDTTDLSSEEWWYGVIESVISTCQRIKPTAACSPALVPNVFTSDYYSMMIRLGNYFAKKLDFTSIKPIQTVLCGLSDLSLPNKPLEIASIISQTHANSIYLIIVNNVVPRRELSNTDELKGVMHLISSLEKSGLPLIVGFSSTDLILWKAAGATACATGKFFNLRRFTSSRFEEPSAGGGQLPYWFEESLLAFLRESDLLRVRKVGMLSKASHENPYSKRIIKQFDSNPGQAWLGLSWRQYLYAFSDIEKRIREGEFNVNDVLKNAEKSWLMLEEKGILMEEMRNNGEWVRIWHRAINEFQQER